MRVLKEENIQNQLSYLRKLTTIFDKFEFLPTTLLKTDILKIITIILEENERGQLPEQLKGLCYRIK